MSREAQRDYDHSQGAPHDECHEPARCRCDCLVCKRAWWSAGRPSPASPDLRDALRELIAAWTEQALVAEKGWNYRTNSEEFNRGAAFVLRQVAEELREAMGFPSPMGTDAVTPSWAPRGSSS